MFSCTWLLQQMAAILNYVSVHCIWHRLTSASYFAATHLYSVQNCENTAKETQQLLKCFTVSPLRSDCLAMHQTTIKTKCRQLQLVFKTRWFSSEAAVRISREILAIWATTKVAVRKKSCNVLCFTATCENKNFNMLLTFCEHCHLTWQNWAKFFRRDILTSPRWMLP